MIQRRTLLLSLVLTLFLALSAIAIRSYFVDTSPAAGENVQLVTATSPSYTGDDSGSADNGDTGYEDDHHDSDNGQEDHDDDHENTSYSSYADEHEDDDHDD